MKAHRSPAVLAALSSALLSSLTALAQTEAVVSQIVDQFNRIESRLPDLKEVNVDATFADSDYGFGNLTVWVDGGLIVKTRNESREDGSVSIQETWFVENRIIFAFERNEWSGNQDGTVSVNESRYYYDNGRAIREMTRSASVPAGSNPDISEVGHEVNDEIEDDYALSLFNEKSLLVSSLVKAAYALAPEDRVPPDLLQWPYRVMLSTLSPDVRYAFAWGIAGVARPDWKRWQTERYDYLTSLGDPKFTLHLLDLTAGKSIGEIEAPFEPGGSAPYFWAKWSDDSRYFIAGSDFRWATGYAALFQIAEGELQEITNLTETLSAAAIEALRKADHPYAVNAQEAMAFIDVKRFEADGHIDFGYAIESKFDGAMRNASLEFQTLVDPRSGTFQVLSSTVGDFEPVPTSWDKFKTLLIASASRWISEPPAVDEYQTLTTFLDDGVLTLYNQFGGFINQDVLEILGQRPLYLSSPNYPGGVIVDERFDFSRYDPESVRAISTHFKRLLTPELIAATQPLYDAKFRSLAKHFQESLRYWQANPAELERQKAAYLNHLKNETLPENYYLLEGDLAQGLMEAYSEDWTDNTCYLTGLRFWLRRSCDGSFAGFADLLQQVIATYDPAYFAYRGLPALKILPSDTGDEEALPELVMDESGALGINHLTPFELDAFQRQLPGLTVVKKEFFNEGGSFPAFGVFSGSTEVLTLISYDPGDPLAFEARSSKMTLRNGIATGDTFSKVFQLQSELGYYNGLETDVGAVITEAPGSEKITLMFQPPPGRHITDTILRRDDLADFILTEMRWLP